MKKIMALVLTGVLVLSPMTVSAANSATAEAVKAAAEAAAAASKAAEQAAAAAQTAASASQAANSAANAAGNAANAAASAANAAGNAASSAAAAANAAASAANKTPSNSTSYGTYYVDNRVTNNYTYKITVKTSGSSKKTPKITITNGGSSGGGKVSVAEGPFYNTISKAPGLDGVIPVGQGGKLVIGGVKTRATFVMRETTPGNVSSAKTLAASIGGSVKNVVETYARGVRFSTCQVDFKVYGCKNGDIYRVFQLQSDGTWKEVQVDDIHEGHVICTVNKAGTFAFIKMN